jgi:hypothetical protein
MANSATIIGSAVSAVPVALGMLGALSGGGSPPPARDPNELIRLVTELDRQCRSETDNLRTERGVMLLALPGGQAIFDQFQSDSDAAAATESAAVQTARADRAKADRDAISVRRTEFDKADTDQRDADVKAREEERTAETNARRTFDDEKREIDKLPLSQQSGPLRNAQDKRDRAIARATEDMNFAFQRNRDAMQRQRQDALDKERRAGETAAENETRAVNTAAAARAQAMQRAEAKLRASFRTIEGGNAILTDVDARLAEHERDCQARRSALLRRPTPGGGRNTE